MRHPLVLRRDVLSEGDAAFGLDLFEPDVPSVAVPDRTTPMARCRCSVASARKNRSIGWWAPRPSRGRSCNTPQR